MFRSLFCIYKKENDRGILGCYNKLKRLGSLEVESKLEMKRYEYMTVDLSAEPSFNVHVKLDILLS